jgi:long-chain fatty acid transport protein
MRDSTHSASGLGVAYSGMAAAVQDGSTVYWNPAGMSWLGGSGVALSADYIIPSFKFTSSTVGSTYEAFGDGGNGGVATLVPAFYGYTMLNPQLAVGLALNAPFGLSTDWNNEWAGMFYAVKSKVQTLNINPSVSWKVKSVPRARCRRQLRGTEGDAHERRDAADSDGAGATRWQ